MLRWFGQVESELGSNHEINLWRKSELFRRKDKIKNLCLGKATENLKKRQMWCMAIGDTRMICKEKKMWRGTLNEFGLK